MGKLNIAAGDGGDFYLAGFDFIEAEDSAEEFGAASADEPGDSEDLAAVKLEGSGGGLLETGNCVEIENDGAGLPGRAGVELFDGSADHHFDHFAGSRGGGIAAAAGFAIAQNGEAIADGADLFEEMGNVDDGVSAGLEATD